LNLPVPPDLRCLKAAFARLFNDEVFDLDHALYGARKCAIDTSPGPETDALGGYRGAELRRFFRDGVRPKAHHPDWKDRFFQRRIDSSSNPKGRSHP